MSQELYNKGIIMLQSTNKVPQPDLNPGWLVYMVNNEIGNPPMAWFSSKNEADAYKNGSGERLAVTAADAVFNRYP